MVAQPAPATLWLARVRDGLVATLECPHGEHGVAHLPGTGYPLTVDSLTHAVQGAHEHAHRCVCLWRAEVRWRSPA